jgi:hypothetical protein
MRFIEDLCSPALLYLIFLVVSLGLDLSLGLWFTFLGKLVVGVAIVFVLNTFCGLGLSPVAWFLVAVPFVITALATAVSMGCGFDDQLMVSMSKESFKQPTPTLDKTKIVDRNPALPGIDAPVDSNAVENVVGV